MKTEGQRENGGREKGRIDRCKEGKDKTAVRKGEGKEEREEVVKI